MHLLPGPVQTALFGRFCGTVDRRRRPDLQAGSEAPNALLTSPMTSPESVIPSILQKKPPAHMPRRPSVEFNTRRAGWLLSKC